MSLRRKRALSPPAETVQLPPVPRVSTHVHMVALQILSSAGPQRGLTPSTGIRARVGSLLGRGCDGRWMKDLLL